MVRHIELLSVPCANANNLNGALKRRPNHCAKFRTINDSAVYEVYSRCNVIGRVVPIGRIVTICTFASSIKLCSHNLELQRKSNQNFIKLPNRIKRILHSIDVWKSLYTVPVEAGLVWTPMASHAGLSGTIV